MEFDLGDVVELDFGKSYLVMGKCNIDLYDYYFVTEREDEGNAIIIKKEPEKEEILVVKDENEIRKALECISGIKN